MIIKTNQELQDFIKGGQITKTVLKAALSEIKVGVSTMQIEQTVARVIKENNSIPSFLGVNAGDGPYPYSCCVSINHQLVHTLPSTSAIIKKGDIVTVDLGVKHKGLHTDTAYTVEVDSKDNEYFLNIGKKALKLALRQVKAGVKTGNLSYEMQKTVEDAGFSVSYDLVGHGIGHKLHEPPQITCFGSKNTGEELKENMVIAVEIMYMKGKPTLTMGKDGFSFDTKDGSLAAQFEHTLVVQKNKPPLIIV
jgi:methionyl aminopeptidase